MSSSHITKNAIAEATKELIRRGQIETITVTEICESCGINRRSFYRHFTDKYEVVDWIYYHEALEKIEHYEGWSIFDYMPRIMDHLYSDRKYYINALKYRGQNSFRDYCTKCLKKLMESDYSSIYDSEKQFDFFTHTLCEMTYDACIDWLSSEPCMSPADFTAYYSDFLIKSFSTSAQLLLKVPDVNVKKIVIKHVSPVKQKTKQNP